MPYKFLDQDATLPAGFGNSIRERFWSKVEKSENGCWLWTAKPDKNGYGYLNRGDNRCVFAHRVSWMINKGEIPEGMAILHSCDNPPCVNPLHLFLGTQTDNMADMMRKQRNWSGPRPQPKRHHPRKHVQHPGKRRVGEVNGSAKLTAANVEEAKRLYSQGGITHREIAGRFGVNRATISSAIAGKIWRG